MQEVTGSIFDDPKKYFASFNNVQAILETEYDEELKKLYPINYDIFKYRCEDGALRPGGLHIYKHKDSNEYVFDMVVKQRPSDDIIISDVERAAEKILSTLDFLNVKYVNIPRFDYSEKVWDKVCDAFDKVEQRHNSFFQIYSID